MRAVFDTNVIINGFEDDFSAHSRLLEAVIDGELIAVITDPVRKEYELIRRRLIDDTQYQEKVDAFLRQAEQVSPEKVDVQIDDPEDLKFIEAAYSGDADVIVTSDTHLLGLGKVKGIDIVTPQEAWTRFEEESGNSSEWSDFMSGLFDSK